MRMATLGRLGGLESSLVRVLGVFYVCGLLKAGSVTAACSARDVLITTASKGLPH